ncbi:MAG: M1 family aminopeptidase, partial [Gemmatimonadota bacterium]
MRVTCLALIANIACVPTMLAAQGGAGSNAELIKGDRYAKPHNYDLIHQRIAVGDFRWDSLSFNGTVTTTIVATVPSLATVRLDEGARLINQKVTDAAGRAMQATHSGDTLTIALARALHRGDTLRFTVVYHGTIKNGDGLTFINNDGLSHRPEQLWSMGETNSNHYWFPTYDEPDDKATWQIVATVPKEDLAISNGRLQSNVVTGDSRTMTWSQDTPASIYLASLIVAPLVVTHDRWRHTPVDYYTYSEDSVRAWPLFHVTVDMIDTYSRLTGVDYPWAKYAQTTVADFFGGMENVSATTLVDWLPDAAAYVDRPWYQHVLIPHELAHQWFGDYVTTANWANMWLNEGFAEFMPGQYWNEKLGTLAEQEYYIDEYEQY